MELTESRSSYADYDLNLHRSIEDICVQMEKEGWRVHCLAGTRLRYWCSCALEHQAWVDTAAELVDARLDFQLSKTCFSFKGDN